MKKMLSAAVCLLLLLTGCLGSGLDDQLPSPSEPASSSQAASSAPAMSALPGSEEPSSVAPTTFTLTIPEGFTLAKIGMTLEEMEICTAAEFIAAAQNGDYSDFASVAAQAYNEHRCFALEGYLFPDTYEFYLTVTPEEIIRTMLRNFENRIAELQGDIANSGYTLDEVVTLASMVEKESLGAPEMANVSSVFHNRLNIGMQLQSDVTIKYVEGAIKPFIDGDENRYNEFYNTYKCPALPAGAICNPGLAAIKAALQPAQTDYLYFLTDANGKFYYAVTFEEHEANIKTAGL